jgi:hypothetical protein
MTWQACVRDCSDFYPAADVSHGRGHTLTEERMISCAWPHTRGVAVHLLRILSFGVTNRLARLRDGSRSISDNLQLTMARRENGPGDRPAYLIFVSLKATCLRAMGSYFLKESFSVAVRGFFFVT